MARAWVAAIAVAATFKMQRPMNPWAEDAAGKVWAARGMEWAADRGAEVRAAVITVADKANEGDLIFIS